MQINNSNGHDVLNTPFIVSIISPCLSFSGECALVKLKRTLNTSKSFYCYRMPNRYNWTLCSMLGGKVFVRMRVCLRDTKIVGNLCEFSIHCSSVLNSIFQYHWSGTCVFTHKRVTRTNEKEERWAKAKTKATTEYMRNEMKNDYKHGTHTHTHANTRTQYHGHVAGC